MRRGPVAAAAFDRDAKFIRGRIARPGNEADRPRLEARVDVQHRDRVDLWIVHSAGLNHRQGATRTFFCGLKQEDGRTVKRLALALQDARRGQQHRRVRVVPTGMHLTRNFGAERLPRTLRERQCVHVGT